MKMDKSKFSAFNKKNEPNDLEFWKTKTIKERIDAACYLISVAYNFDVNNPPKVDRTIFSMGKLDE